MWVGVKLGTHHFVRFGLLPFVRSMRIYLWTKKYGRPCHWRPIIPVFGTRNAHFLSFLAGFALCMPILGVVAAKVPGIVPAPVPAVVAVQVPVVLPVPMLAQWWLMAAHHTCDTASPCTCMTSKHLGWHFPDVVCK